MFFITITGQSFYRMNVADNKNAIKGNVQMMDYEFKNSKVIFSFFIEETGIGKNWFDLRTFDRIDHYARFRFCMPDKKTDPKVCVCADNEFKNSEDDGP